MSKVILFIVEGGRAEPKIVKNISDIFLKKYKIDCISYKTDIYQLYNNIFDEDGYSEDIFPYLQQRSNINSNLRQFERNDIAEIFLFFDYDGHATNSNPDKIRKMLDYFDCETDNGKLYVSYPMIEAIKDNPLKHPTSDICLGKKYKSCVNTRCGNELNHLDKWNVDNWRNQINTHLIAGNYLINDEKNLPSYDVFINKMNQYNIFESQLCKHINHSNKVSILGAFLYFICEYKGNRFFENNFNNSTI